MMGIFDWLFGPTVGFIRTDEQGNQFRLTPAEYGAQGVQWAVAVGGITKIELSSYGKNRKPPDIITKIRHVPLIASAHGVAFFVAVYCTYPVIRLGISNDAFKDVVQGATDSILTGTYLVNKHPTSPEYLNQLIVEVTQYIAILLENAGSINHPDQDKLLFGIGGALQRLITLLDREYSEVDFPANETQTELSNAANSSAQKSKENWFDGSFKNPGIEATRAVKAEKLLSSTFGNIAVRFVKEIDARKGIRFG